jgi:hypothetical protein
MPVFKLPAVPVKFKKGKRADSPVKETVAERIKAIQDRRQEASQIGTKQRT